MSEIETPELIDTTENKPKIEAVEPDNNVEPQGEVKRLIDYKPVSKLTEDEKSYLINLYKNGGEDNHFKVYFYKNGTNKIVKKKQPPQRLSAKLLDKIENSKKPSLTNEQLLMEHVIDLETKFATLQQKHKKLKKYYKSLHEDIYADDAEVINYTDISKGAGISEGDAISKGAGNGVANEANEFDKFAGNGVAIDNNEVAISKGAGISEGDANVEQNYQNNYINRIRRQPKGYRKMMGMNGFN